MPLSLFKGPVGSGKTKAVLRQLEPFARRQAGLCITPSDSASFELRQSFLKEKDALLGDTFIPIHHFIRKTADADVPVLTLREQVLFIYQILSMHPLRYFKSASLGVARQAAEAITTLKKNFISAQDLNLIPALKKRRREQDLITLFERYEDEKKARRFLDEGDLFLIAYENIEKGNAKILDGIKFLVFDEFHQLNTGLFRFIGLLLNKCKDTEIVVTLPTIDENETLIAAHLQKMFDKMSGLAPKTVSFRNEKEIRIPERKNIVLRSPLQETRFIVMEVMHAIEHQTPAQKIAICLRRGDHKLFDILTELEELGLATRPHRLGSPLSAPIIHELLSGELISSLPDSAPMNSFAEQIRNALKQLHEKAGWEPMLEKHQDHLSHELIARSLIALAEIEEVIKSLTHAALTVSLNEMSREMFIDLLFNECVSPVPSASDISKVTDIRFINFEDGPSIPTDLLILPQMIEEKIPASLPDRLFFASSESDDESLLQNIFPRAEDALAEEAFLLHRLIAKTKCDVVFCHPAIDHSGDEVIPSSFLDPLKDAKPIDVPMPIRKEIFSLKGNLKQLMLIEQERLLGEISHPTFHGRIVSEDVKSMIRERFTREALSPSRIETYANCPFKFFVESVLNLKPPEEITPEIQPKDRGTIVHAILEHFYRDHLDIFKKAVKDPNATAVLDRILNVIVDRVFEDHAKIIGYAAKGLLPNAKRAARTMALQVILNEIESSRVIPKPLFPLECEWIFGQTNETCLTLAIEESPPALIRGRIDRIDVTDDRSSFAVIDYKTGRNVSSVMNKIKKGLHVQLPLYVEAVKQLYLKESNPLGGLLLAVLSVEKKHGFLKKSYNDIHFAVGKRSHSILEDDEWEKILMTALNVAATNVGAIRNANFEVRPKECPHHCDYEDICRYNRKGADELAAQGD